MKIFASLQQDSSVLPTGPAIPPPGADGVLLSCLLVSLNSRRPAPTEGKRAAIGIALLQACPDQGGGTPQWWGKGGSICCLKISSRSPGFWRLNFRGCAALVPESLFLPWGTRWTEVNYYVLFCFQTNPSALSMLLICHITLKSKTKGAVFMSPVYLSAFCLAQAGMLVFIFSIFHRVFCGQRAYVLLLFLVLLSGPAYCQQLFL